MLKSPLFGLTEEQLFALAWNRERARCARRCARRRNDLAFADAHARLERYAAWARHETPFGFYARILGADKGRARFYARLGAGGGRRAR